MIFCPDGIIPDSGLTGPNNAYCDGKFFKIPKRDFNFCTCEDGAGWHLIPCRISPRSEFFLRHIRTGILCGGSIYVQTDRRWQGVSNFTLYSTPTKATRLPPLDNGRYGPLG